MKTVLVVDDDEIVSSVTEAMLEALGYEVLIAHDIPKARHLFQEHQERVSLIISDYVMPGCSGIKSVQSIRQGREVPIILCTGYGDTIPEMLEQQKEVQGILKKPFDLDELERLVNHILIFKSDEEIP
ncbi:MAG: response regulator [bacterium]|jgi:DNA-binding NtrC family response regulator